MLNSVRIRLTLWYTAAMTLVLLVRPRGLFGVVEGVR